MLTAFTKLPDEEPTHIVIHSSQTAKRTTEAKQLDCLLKLIYKHVFWLTLCSSMGAGQPTTVSCLLRDHYDRQWNKLKIWMLNICDLKLKMDHNKINPSFRHPNGQTLSSKARG